MRVFVMSLLVLNLSGIAACAERNPFLGECGNNTVEEGEECDLGAANGPDAACTAECRLPACGDGVVQDGEACDLGEGNRR